MGLFRTLLFGGLVLTLADTGMGTTRLRTDEVTSSDGGPVTFTGGIVAPIVADMPVSTTSTGFQTSATYSAVIDGQTNLDGVTTPATLKYERFGKYVHVWGRVQTDPTTGSQTLTTFNINVPFSGAAFTNTAQAMGTAGLPATIANGVCNAKASTFQVECTYGAVSTTADLVNVNFWYTTNN